MYWLLLIGAPALLLFILVLIRWYRDRHPGRIAYNRREFILSPEERQLHTALHEALGEQYVIFPMIHVEDLITARDDQRIEKTWDMLDEAGESIFPFVLARKEDLGIACAIQLVQHRVLRSRDNPSPESPLRAICQSAGLPLARLEAGPFYDLEDIHQAVAEAVRREPLFVTESDGRREPTIDRLERLDLD